jgi:hypothetical protein
MVKPWNWLKVVSQIDSIVMPVPPIEQHRASPSECASLSSIDPEKLPHVVDALQILATAHDLAIDCDRNVWDFAVEFHRLTESNVTHDELRWLMAKGHICHAYEIDCPEESRRAFYSKGSFVFARDSCFVITELGIDLAAALSKELKAAKRDQAASSSVIGKPHWDSNRRLLTFGNRVVKRFKWRAYNQETILQAFEEEEWTGRIDDPLPQSNDVDPKRRLNESIRSLNSSQVEPIIRFRGDGSGQGVVWTVEVQTK